MTARHLFAAAAVVAAAVYVAHHIAIVARLVAESYAARHPDRRLHPTPEGVEACELSRPDPPQRPAGTTDLDLWREFDATSRRSDAP